MKDQLARVRALDVDELKRPDICCEFEILHELLRETLACPRHWHEGFFNYGFFCAALQALVGYDGDISFGESGGPFQWRSITVGPFKVWPVISVGSFLVWRKTMLSKYIHLTGHWEQEHEHPHFAFFNGLATATL